jgi:hypothetical protein
MYVRSLPRADPHTHHHSLKPLPSAVPRRKPERKTARSNSSRCPPATTLLLPPGGVCSASACGQQEASARLTAAALLTRLAAAAAAAATASVAAAGSCTEDPVCRGASHLRARIRDPPPTPRPKAPQALSVLHLGRGCRASWAASSDVCMCAAFSPPLLLLDANLCWRVFTFLAGWPACLPPTRRFSATCTAFRRLSARPGCQPRIKGPQQAHQPLHFPNLFVFLSPHCLFPLHIPCATIASLLGLFHRRP